MKDALKKEVEKETMRRSFKLEMDYQTKMQNVENEMKNQFQTNQSLAELSTSKEQIEEELDGLKKKLA